MDTPIKILVGANDSYAMPMTVAVHSALRHIGAGHRVHVHVLDGGISDFNKGRTLRTVLGAYPSVKVFWENVNLSKFSSINVRHYSAASLIRLLVPDIFGKEVSRVLYLDSDLIVEADLSELWGIDLAEKALWATQNGDDSEFDNLIRSKFPEIEAPEGARYFNSGVLLINLPEWRRQRISERALDILNKHSSRLSFPDQDALNAVVAGNWGRLPSRWNTQIIRLGQPESALLRERGILHYTSYKPWVPSYSWPAGHRFHRAYLRTGWESASAARKTVMRLSILQFLHRTRARIRNRIGI